MDTYLVTVRSIYLEEPMEIEVTAIDAQSACIRANRIAANLHNNPDLVNADSKAEITVTA